MSVQIKLKCGRTFKSIRAFAEALNLSYPCTYMALDRLTPDDLWSRRQISSGPRIGSALIKLADGRAFTSNAEFAAAIGVTRPTVCRWLKVETPDQIVARLAGAE